MLSKQCEELLKDKLVLLTSKIDEAIKDIINSEEFKPDEQTYQKWHVNKFEYTDSGSVSSGMSGEFITKKSWISLTISLNKAIDGSNEVLSCVDELKNCFDEIHSKSYMDSFIRKYVYSYLEEKLLTGVIGFIDIFLKELRNEPIKYWSEVEIQGINMRVEEIIIDNSLKIRRIRKEDIEKEVPVYPFFYSQHSIPMHPNAIIDISSQETQPYHLQDKIELIITILRLFRSGSVKWTAYNMESESIIQLIGGRHTSGITYLPNNMYLLKEEDVTKLREFFKQLREHIPKNFYRNQSEHINYVTIAYNRYCDALLEHGIVEKRIASIMMGLEAIYSNQNQELSYQLKTRISKFLSLLGQDPHTIKRKISDAYTIRSIYSHGDILDYDKKKRYEIKYGDLDKFFIELANILRISIVLTILLKFEKNKLIDKIEESMMDRKSEDELLNHISQWKIIL